MSECEQILAALNDAFNALYHSLAQYVVDARPYVRPGEEALLREVGAIAAEDRRLADRVAETIERLEGVPQLVLPDPFTAAYNYLALAYLAGVLEERLTGELARFESALKLTEAPYPTVAQKQAAETLGELAAVRRDQLARLRVLRAPSAPAGKAA